MNYIDNPAHGSPIRVYEIVYKVLLLAARNAFVNADVANVRLTRFQFNYFDHQPTDELSADVISTPFNGPFRVSILRFSRAEIFYYLRP